MIKLLLILLPCFLAASEVATPLQETYVESSDTLNLDSKLLNYQVIAGALILKDKDGKDRAEIGYTAYFLKGSESKDRPISFCFNGGPGAASVWLNVGFMGPKRVKGEDLVFQDPPYALIDNESSLLDKTDMVFIDPVSTGFSRLAPGGNTADLYGVDEDVQGMVDFIRLFTGHYKRYDSPKYFVSESYGGLRAAKAAYKLHDDYGYYLNGMLFVSPGIDMQTIMAGGCNDLPYMLFLPSMTAVAHYHHKISGDLSSLLKEAENFAATTYAHALFLGDKINEGEKRSVAEKLAQLTSLPPDLIMRMDLRIPPYRFIKELLQNQGKVIGRFDGRVVGIDSKESEVYSAYDPSLDAVFGSVTSAFTQYLLNDLKWPRVMDYHVLVPLSPWNWGKGNQYASGLKEMRNLMAQNPKLKVVFMSGLYDLATPYGSTEFSISHIGQNQEELSRIDQFLYPAGHMMYYNDNIRKSMKKDLIRFFN